MYFAEPLKSNFSLGLGVCVCVGGGKGGGGLGGLPATPNPTQSILISSFADYFYLFLLCSTLQPWSYFQLYSTVDLIMFSS